MRLSHTSLILNVIKDKAMGRGGAVLAYALGIKSKDVDWLEINNAIINRWSHSDLNYIKERAREIAGLEALEGYRNGK